MIQPLPLLSGLVKRQGKPLGSVELPCQHLSKRWSKITIHPEILEGLTVSAACLSSVY